MNTRCLIVACCAALAWPGCSASQNLGSNDGKKQHGDPSSTGDAATAGDGDSAMRDGGKSGGDGDSANHGDAGHGKGDAGSKPPVQTQTDQVCSVGGQDCTNLGCCAGKCQTTCMCTKAGGNCQTHEQCCSGVCAGNLCAPCNKTGESCSTNANCCSGNCQDQICGGNLGHLEMTVTVAGKSPQKFQSSYVYEELGSGGFYTVIVAFTDSTTKNYHQLTMYFTGNENGTTLDSVGYAVDGRNYYCGDNAPCGNGPGGLRSGEHFIEGKFSATFAKYFDGDTQKDVMENTTLDVTFRTTVP